jgi:hypothetical protein
LFDIFIDDLVAGLHACSGGSIWGRCYTDDANALSAPQWLAKLMDYIHTWLNKWRMQGNFTKSKVMVFHPKGESCSAGEGPPERLD